MNIRRCSAALLLAFPVSASAFDYYINTTQGRIEQSNGVAVPLAGVSVPQMQVDAEGIGIFTVPGSITFASGDRVFFRGGRAAQIMVQGNLTIPEGVLIDASGGTDPTNSGSQRNGGGGAGASQGLSGSSSAGGAGQAGGAGGAGGQGGLLDQGTTTPNPGLAGGTGSDGQAGETGDSGGANTGADGFRHPASAGPAAGGGAGGAGGARGPSWGFAAPGGEEGGPVGSGEDGANGLFGVDGGDGADGQDGGGGRGGRYPTRDGTLRGGGGGSSGRAGGSGGGGGSGASGGGGGGGGSSGLYLFAGFFPKVDAGGAGGGGGDSGAGGAGGDGTNGGRGGIGAGAFELRATGLVTLGGTLRANGEAGGLPSGLPEAGTAGSAGAPGTTGTARPDPTPKGGRGGDGAAGGHGGDGGNGGLGAPGGGGSGGTIILKSDLGLVKLPTATIQTSGGAAGGPGAEAGQSGAYYESAPTGLLGLEQFDYPDGPIASRNGGAFWNWRNQTPAGRTAGVSDWDNDTGTPAIASGRLITQNNSATREYNGPGEGLPITTDEGLGAISAFDNGSLSFRHKVVYCRVTLTTGASVTPDASIGIRSLDFGTERVVFGKKAGSTTFGIEESGVSNTNSTTAVAPNTTYTLVTKLDFGNGSTGIASLFLDPDLNAVEPAPLVTRAFNASLWSTSVNLRSGGGSPIAWDDLVVAASWDELGTVVTTATDEDNGSLNPAAGTGVSLREAVKFSPSGTLITFAPGLSGQTITLTHPDGDMEIPNSVTIDAAALPGGLTLSGNNVTRHFQVPIRTFLTLRGLALTDGHPDGDGGAIYNQGWLTADRCSFSGNISTSDGGAILNTSGGTMTLTHCTLSGNTAKYGGAILGDDAALTLTHCTLSGNSAATVGGALLSIGSTLTLTNSILAGNTANSAPDFHQDIGVLFTNGVNLIGNLTDSGLTAGPTILTGDAKLSPLGHFGGPVMTMHPLIGSPAIDAAGSTDPGGTDARGFPRFVDGNDASAGAQLDIGAVEAGLLLKVLASGDGGGATLRSTLALINAASTQGLRVAFDPALFPASTITLAGSNELTAPAGKAFFIDASNLTGPVTISGNNASRVFNIPATATVAMHSVNIVNGKATILSHGGGILNGGRLTMEACRVENNRSVDSADGSLPLPGGSGGGIRNTGILSMTNSRITGNQTGRGGNATGTDESGARSGNGGGISNRGILTLTDCAVADNATGQGGNATPGGTGTGGYGVGGGVSHEGASARFTATRCSFTGNHADRNGRDGNGQVRTDGAPGGGIDAHAAMTLESCTIAGNFSADTSYGGGGVALFDDTVVLRHCTVANNTTTGPGAGIFCFHSTQLTLQNCVVAGNITPDSIKDLRIPNTTTYVGANLLGTAASGSGTPTGPAPIINANPLLAPLGDYGGRTQTMPPRPGSPAIDAGTTTTLLTDQRGLPRTRDGDGNGTALPDLGAVEASHVLVTNTSDTGTGSLRAALTEAAAQPGADTVFFTSAVTPHITLASEILITDPAGVTIDASDRPTGIVIDGGPGANRHFRIDPTSIVTLQRLQLTGGNGGGGGSPASYGGSIFNGGSLTVRECTLHGNTSGIAGAIYNQAGALTVERSTFHSNTATNVGAILHESLTPMLITASTFTNNNGGLEGGAITVSNFRPATLTHCTISGNRVTQTGGGGGGGIRTIAGAGNLLTLGQSIVSGNTDANTPGTPDINPGFISQGDNVIGGDARLSPLLDFGGPTWTMALRPGSIARNAAFTSTATFDQRGYSIIGPADIGAYEASNPWLFNYNAYIWESLPPTATAAQAASAFDFDGDGQSNEDEWLAFTTATDPGSVFAFTGHVLNGLNMEISFLSVTGRTYDVEASNDLVTWANLGTFPGHGGTLVLPIGPVGADQRMFFRIRPRLP